MGRSYCFSFGSLCSCDFRQEFLALENQEEVHRQNGMGDTGGKNAQRKLEITESHGTSLC